MARAKRQDAALPEDDRSGLFDDQFIKKLEYLHLVARKAFTGQFRAERRTKKIGSGIEFADHRRYSFGDDFRYIDWNIYGRLDRLLLRLFEEEEDLHIYLLLDTSRSMLLGRPLKLHYAMQVCAALAYIGLGNLDRVGIVPFANKLQPQLPPARGKGRIFKVFDFLQQTPAGGVTDLARSMDSFVHQNKRRGLAVVISDFYDPRGFESGMNELRYNRFEPFVLQVTDEREANPHLHGDLALVDCETGETREVTVSRSLLAEYKKEHDRYLNQLKSYCTSRSIPYFRTLTSQPVDELILGILRRGGFLK